MRILYLSQYFPPEVGATQARSYEMAKGLVRQGHSVTMVAEVPCHPHGVVAPEYRRKLWVRRELEGIDVIHVWVKASQSKGMRSRLLFYISYMMMATVAGLFVARGRYDFVYCTSPPLFTGGTGLVLSFLRRLPLVFEVRDMWPESAVALGQLKNRTAIRLSSALARRCYRRSARVVAVTEGIRRDLIELGVSNEKITLIPNGANTEIFRPVEQEARRLRVELGFGDRFIAAYAGNLGLAYSLITLLGAAERLRDRSDIQFLVIGAGPKSAALREEARLRRLENVEFAGQVSYAELPSYLTASDVALIPMRSFRQAEGTLPVKMFDAWACGCPTILGMSGGEASDLTEKSGGGVVIPPEDPGALAEAIVELAADRDGARSMGARGRAFVVANYSRQMQAEELGRMLVGLADARGTS